MARLARANKRCGAPETELHVLLYQMSQVLDSIPATTDNPSSPSVTSFTFSLSSLDHMDDDYKQNFCGRGGDPKSFLLGSSNSLHDEPPIVDEISGLNYRAPILYSV